MSAAALLAQLVRGSGAARVAFLGLAKNVGKTTALVAVLSRLHEDGVLVGATSVGRDGEAFDALTGEKKPRFLLWPGQWVASAESTFAAASPGAELIQRLPFSTRFGSIEIRRMTHAGEIEVIGPTTISQLSQSASALEGAGALLVLIDGAFGRRAFASARIADGIVLSVGVTAGGVSGSIDRALAAVDLIGLTTPPPDSPLRVFEGALTDEKLAENPPHSGETVVAEDFASIFLSSDARIGLAGRAIGLSVRRPARLLAITANPHGPERESASASEFFQLLAEALPEVTIVDVASDLCHAS